MTDDEAATVECVRAELSRRIAALPMPVSFDDAAETIAAVLLSFEDMSGEELTEEMLEALAEFPRQFPETDRRPNPWKEKVKSEE